MSIPTNPVLANVPDLVADAEHEVWSVTSHMLVKKGVNVEEAMATWVELQNAALKDYTVDPANVFASGMKFVDITKL